MSAPLATFGHDCPNSGAGLATVGYECLGFARPVLPRVNVTGTLRIVSSNLRGKLVEPTRLQGKITIV